LLVALSSGVLLAAQQSKDSSLHTYHSPDGSLGFQYSDRLVLCQQDPKQEGFWKPAKVCEAYMPLCPDARYRTGILVCLALQGGPAEENSTFTGAAFSVLDLGPAKDETACLQAAWPHGSAGDWRMEKINGIGFHVTEVDGAAMGHWTDGHAYRTLHQGRCYELDSIITGVDGQMTEPPTKEFNEDLVKKTVNLPVSTFRFLK
jgi:hypothetical protein